MPTNRQKRTRKRRDHDVPQWVKRYLETGETPERNSEDWDQYLGWYYFNEPVPGLPSPSDMKHGE